MSDYYNEHDPFAAAWLRELIAAGEIPAGHVDERSIEDVVPSDLVGYRHCHFFAGIGGWALAMRFADWPDDLPLWTGSCPCQPFSAAGQGAGFADQRHLWPAFHWLIRQCRPRYVCGEQVASADALVWWDLVATDLEGAGYACTAVDLPAASVGAPHKRSRLFWLAGQSHACGHQPDGCGDAGDGMGDTGLSRLQGLAGDGDTRHESRRQRADTPRPVAPASGADAWADCVWLHCTDGKARPTQPSIQPLAYGVPNRVGTLRGAGNAIVPQVAAEVLRAWQAVMQ